MSSMPTVVASKAIFQLLSGDTTLRSLLGASSSAPKVFPERVLGDSVELPAITFSFRSSLEAEARGGGENILSEPQFAIQAAYEGSPNSESFGPVADIAARVRDLLCGTGDGMVPGLSLVIDGYIVNGVIMEQPIHMRQTLDNRTTYYAGGLYRLRVSKAS